MMPLFVLHAQSHNALTLSSERLSITHTGQNLLKRGHTFPSTHGPKTLCVALKTAQRAKRWVYSNTCNF